MPEADQYVLPGDTNHIWRAWLMTGVRRDRGDPRRVRGAHLGLKRMLVEGMNVHVDKPYTWKEFSDAMVRQAVGDAVRSLPREDSHLLKLAYFGGMSNQAIADEMGLKPATVERRLRRAIEVISDYVQRGRGLGQRALAGLLAVFAGRWLHDTALSAAQATAMAGVAMVLIAQPAPPSVAPADRVDGPAVQSAAPAPVVPPIPSPAPPGMPAGTVAPAPAPAVDAAPAVPQAPVTALTQVQLPAAPVAVPVALPPLPVHPAAPPLQPPPLPVKTPAI